MSDQYASLGQASYGNSINDLSQPLASGKGWMKFVGILIAWLPIWIGVLIMQSAGALERAQLSGDAAAFKESLAKLRTFFIIQGVLYIVGIVLTVLYFMFFGAMFGAMLKSGAFPHH